LAHTAFGIRSAAAANAVMGAKRGRDLGQYWERTTTPIGRACVRCRA